MQRLKKIFWTAMTLAVLALGVFLGLTVARWQGGGLRFEKTATIIQQVQTLSDLVTVKYVMQKVEFVDSPPGSTLGQFVQGDNKVLLLAQGVVKAGIDLKKIAPGDVAISGKRLTISLPRPQITDAYLDDSQTKVLERTTGFLRSLRSLFTLTWLEANRTRWPGVSNSCRRFWSATCRSSASPFRRLQCGASGL